MANVNAPRRKPRGKNRPKPPSDYYMTRKEAAVALSCDVDTISKWIREGYLQSVSAGPRGIRLVRSQVMHIGKNGSWPEGVCALCGQKWVKS